MPIAVVEMCVRKCDQVKGQEEKKKKNLSRFDFFNLTFFAAEHTRTYMMCVRMYILVSACAPKCTR